VHSFRGTDDGIDRASLNTQGAANAPAFINGSNTSRAVLAAIGVKRDTGLVEKAGQGIDDRLATRWAAVNGACVLIKRLSVGKAAAEATLAALGLRQQQVYGFDAIHTRADAARGLSRPG
jgi:hypothetical protein